ncbi:hypothetical protein N7468_003685 [Penicillium chermesinum]|uniref:Tetraspanin Tsp3 n=1 Tax=Penicillium chermesinum TaxID=63820 RepID=A0A9W9P7N2_9EURO|nr:uncharacterized protein N7468_003685 [Penicillium chermesinum]KAJ5239066.1 hypothetical protein N7468_003685 [Penicillium chermesinum]KAJ6164705.1 hypothetical protein N7470_003377 [Penicillium chermesinum]
MGLVGISLGALAWSQTISLYLPVPAWISAAATLLTPVLGLALAVFSALALKTTSQRDRAWYSTRIQGAISLLNHLHTILSTVLATLALAYMFPESLLSCNIEQQWQQFFHVKNSEAVRTIQDSLQCCGLRSTRDRAWPFKDKNHGDEACEVQLGYSRSCIEPWMARQRKASWMTFAAVLLIVVLKVAAMSWNRRKPSWLSNDFSETGSGSRGYRRITNERDEAHSEDNLRSSETNNDLSRG